MAAFTTEVDRGMYERQRERVEQYKAMLRKIADGEGVNLHDIQWSDPLWQQGVIHTLREAGEWREDSRKLSVIKEVFGGAK